MELSRRNFLKGTGALAGISAMGAIGLGCSPAANEGTEAKGGKAEAPKTPAETTPTTLKEATDGKFTAIDGYSAEYEAGQLDDEVRSILLPLLNLEDDMYTDLAASVSSMMVRSYAVAIVKPAEGKTDAVKSALEAYVTSEQQSMEHYLEDQYQIAKAATVTVAPTGEVILVCAENHDTLLTNIEKALAA